MLLSTPSARAAPGQLPGHRGPQPMPHRTTGPRQNRPPRPAPATLHLAIARSRSPHLLRHSPRCLSPSPPTVAPAPAAPESCKATSGVPAAFRLRSAALWAVSGVGYHSRGRGGQPLVARIGLRVLHGQGDGKLPVPLYRTTPYRRLRASLSGLLWGRAANICTTCRQS